MHRRWMGIVTLAVLLAARAVGFGDWKSHLAKKAVGEAAREGIGDAVRDAAFEDALGHAGRRVSRAVSHTGVGWTASAGIESAMTAANVASSMDDALDAAEAARKANRARKAIRKIR